jgi:hypothetical protein
MTALYKIFHWAKDAAKYVGSSGGLRERLTIYISAPEKAIVTRIKSGA